MPTLNVYPQFADDVEAGIKLTSIRKETDLKVGDTFVLKCDGRQLGFGTVWAIEPIEIGPPTKQSGLKGFRYKGLDLLVTFPDQCQTGSRCWLMLMELRALVAVEGFNFVEDFLEFIQNHYGLPFKGVIVKWRLK